MPRPYRLGERAGQMQATRDRIIDAAIDLFAEVGISGATMRQVGLRADVAPGTLRNHFATRRELEDAMLARLMSEGPLPDLSIFDGTDSLEARVDVLLRTAGRFFDQAARLYRMWLREPLLQSPWTEAGVTYGARWAQLQQLALGPLADDEDVRAVFRATMSPPFFESLRGGTRSMEEAGALAAAAITPWLRARLEGSTRDGR